MLTGFTFGNTPLHTAVQYGQIEVVFVLVPKWRGNSTEGEDIVEEVLPAELVVLIFEPSINVDSTQIGVFSSGDSSKADYARK